jgi:hypothetical protein
MEPTEIQKEIINYDGNTAILASPGSGKTYVISEKIKRILKDDNLHPYQGVVAISYTRKASAHLKRRTLGEGIPPKNSFFGTIDNFCLTQIILHFGSYVFGHPQKELEVIGINDLGSNKRATFNWITTTPPDYKDIDAHNWNPITNLYRDGYVLVESLELLSLHIMQNCKACQNHLRARYKYIFIDEYQDADTYTNQIFTFMVSLGIKGIAVGDEKQSIFGFAHKSNIFLKALETNQEFRTFKLDRNFRCSIPIINYSNRLLNPNSEILETTEEGVSFILVKGSEQEIANYLNVHIPQICEKLHIEDKSEVAILVKNLRTQNIIDQCLAIPHRAIETTVLDKDLNPRSRLYAILLRFCFDAKMPLLAVIDEFVDFEELSIFERKQIQQEGDLIRAVCYNKHEALVLHFQTIASLILKNIEERHSIKKLRQVLQDEHSLNSYKPTSSNEVQIMTLHKSKGLEFEVVFHLNMSEWELPAKRIENNDFNNPIYTHWEQDLNLHYVGITRAKKECILVRGTKRTNSNNDLKCAKDSEFLSINDLPKLRKQ